MTDTKNETRLAFHIFYGGAEPASLQRSTDGGRTWAYVLFSPPTPENTENTIEEGERGVDRVVGPLPQFFGPNHQDGVVVASLQRNPGLSTTLMSTNDGGATWTLLGPLPNGETDVSFVDANHGWAGLFATSDGGRHWSKAGTYPKTFELPSVYPQWLSARIGVLMDANQRLFRTDDAGQHWTRLPSIPAS